MHDNWGEPLTQEVIMTALTQRRPADICGLRHWEAAGSAAKRTRRACSAWSYIKPHVI